ncbi:MAG: hypothetical protein JW810_03910 [Sedimentisphaerales bacterium]|nr:hypothetical protein [Sedimentisphaerales bacterium]
MKAVVDTNVPVVTNGKSEQASKECVINCVTQLELLMKTGTLVLDDSWRIIGEYQNNLRSDGQPGFGDSFLKWVLTNYANPQRCELVSITPMDSKDEDYEEFPHISALSDFDPSDKKFVSVAIAHTDTPPIWQAVDADWWKRRNILRENRITIEFLCPKDVRRLAK